MKIWLVGSQGTCRSEIAKLLEADKFRIGRLFTTLPKDINICHKELYNYYTTKDVNSLFENTAYVFINDTFINPGNYDGLTLSDYDDADVFVLNIEQFMGVNTKYISKDDLIVWVDGTRDWRMHNIEEELYDIKSREEIERSNYTSFGSTMDSMRSSFKNVIYFNNELPERIKTIIKVIYSNPKLKTEFVKNFA